MAGTTTHAGVVSVGTVRTLIQRLRARLSGAARWVVLTVVGGLLIAAGIVMLFTPGPGWGAIVLGLYLWAKQFTWARRILARFLDWLDSHRHRLPKLIGRLIDNWRARQAAEARHRAPEPDRSSTNDERADDGPITPAAGTSGAA